VKDLDALHAGEGRKVAVELLNVELGLSGVVDANRIIRSASDASGDEKDRDDDANAHKITFAVARATRPCVNHQHGRVARATIEVTR